MKRLSGLALAACLGISTAAHAESAQDSALELKLGIYTPQIDSEAGLKGATPYQTYFGGRNMLLFEAEYEYQLYQGFGSFALGGSVGYGEIYGHGYFTQGPNAGQVSGDLTALKVYPLHLLAIYRFDPLAKRWHVPLVPFAKLGLDCDLFQITDGTGGTATDPNNNQKGQGDIWGWEGDIGLAFLLDVLDQDLATDFDLDVGINHSYLFAEWSYASLNNFGGPALILSDSFIKFGLAVEF